MDADIPHLTVREVECTRRRRGGEQNLNGNKGEVGPRLLVSLSRKTLIERKKLGLIDITDLINLFLRGLC